jgi:hypothetical protein
MERMQVSKEASKLLENSPASHEQHPRAVYRHKIVFILFIALLLVLLPLLHILIASPQQVDLHTRLVCEGDTFFDCFDFFTDPDPTQGYVDYVSKAEAAEIGLISINSSVIRIGADMANVASGRGRKSVRLTSKKSFDSGLVLIDLAHIPTGCGTW